MKKTHVRKNELLFEWTNTYVVMGHFFKYPSIEFTLSEVARNTGLSKASVSGIINNLREVGFVEIKDLGVVYRIRANADNYIYKREKIGYNFASLIRSNIVEFLVNKFRNPKCIIVFGSFRKGEDDRGSDIDIALEVSKGENTGIFVYSEFKEFEKLLERKVTVHAFERGKIDDNLFVNMANGIVLHGFLEVRK